MSATKRTLRSGTEVTGPETGTTESVKTKRSRGTGTGPSNNVDQDNNPLIELFSQKFEEFTQRLNILEQNIVSTSSSDHNLDQSSTLSVNSHEVTLPQVNSGFVETSSIGSNANANITYIMHPTVPKPMFNGRDIDISPVKFLKKLQKYIKAVNGQNRAIEIAIECLSGTALKLLEIYSETWVKFEDFEKDFLKVFWGQKQQEIAKYNLVNSVHSPGSGLSMSEHFANQIDSVRSLTIPMSESDMVNCVMRHFTIDIQRLWFTKGGIVNIFSAAEFLRDIEQNVKVRTGTQQSLNHMHNRDSLRGRAQIRQVNSMSTFSTFNNNGNFYRGRGRGSTRGRGNFRVKKLGPPKPSYDNKLPKICFNPASDSMPNNVNNVAHKESQNKDKRDTMVSLSQGNEMLSSVASTSRQ